MQGSKIRSILVIDDDHDDFDLVTEAIHGIDPAISVSYLDRCEDGLKYKNHEFDLVFLDINMPAHDGFDWLKGLRAHGCDLPIVMYTNSSSPTHIVRAYAEGATLYFNKPDNYLLLSNSIRKLLNLDWSNPLSIRDMYSQDGKHRMFQPA